MYVWVYIYIKYHNKCINNNNNNNNKTNNKNYSKVLPRIFRLNELYFFRIDCHYTILGSQSYNYLFEY